MINEYCDTELRNVNAEDVVKSIESLKGITSKAISTKIKRHEEELKRDLEYIKENPTKNPYNEQHWMWKYVEKLKGRIKKLKSLEKKGFKYVNEIGFGDNHGDVCGGKVGYAMDYDGRSINLSEDDFVVMTEQNR